MKRLVLALQFLTRLPLPAVVATEADFAASMRWFPAAGLVVGAVVAVGAWIGVRIDPWIGALMALAAWVMVTGALHLDGLGDIADAAGAAHADPARLSAVLADPHIGSFGVTAIALQLLAKLVLLHQLLLHEPVWLLAVVPAVARVAPLVWTLALPPLHDGLGSRFRAGISYWHVAAWSLPWALLLPVFPGLGIAILAVVLWGMWLCARIGGISGDGHGAGIEIVETALLFALAATA
jgi:adenosylcobinamide-GDP ribazoletransferase